MDFLAIQAKQVQSREKMKTETHTGTLKADFSLEAGFLPGRFLEDRREGGVFLEAI